MPTFARALLIFSLLMATNRPWAAEFVFSEPDEPHLAREMAEKISREAFRRMGHELEFKPLPLERGLLETNAGKHDGVLMRANQGFAQYPDLLPVSFPIAEDDFVAFGMSQIIKPQGWESLKPYRLVSLRGIKLIEALGPDYRFDYVSNLEQLFRFLQVGRADLAIITRGSACAPVQLGIRGVQIQEPALATVRFYLHLHARHAALIKPLETTLQKMQQDGSLRKLQDEARRKWTDC